MKSVVICQRGLVTPESSEFYSPAIHLLNSSIALIGDEIKPADAHLNEIIGIIHESDLAYELRLRVPLNIAKSQLFSVERDASILLHDLNKIFKLNLDKPYQFFSKSEKDFAGLSKFFFSTTKDKKPDFDPAPLPDKEPCQP